MNLEMRAYHRNWQNGRYANDPEFRTKKVERVRAYRAAHPEAVALSNKRYRERHHAETLLRHAKDRQKRRAYVAQFKMRPCTDCGGNFPPECMDFDHVKGCKIKSVSMMITTSIDAVLSEIAKCEVVCANCHRIRTEKRRRERRKTI